MTPRCSPRPPRRSIVVALVLPLALSTSGSHHCNAFATPSSSIPRPSAVAASASNTGRRSSNVGQRRHLRNSFVAAAPSLQLSSSSSSSSTTPENTTAAEAEEEEISSILRPPYPIEPIPLRIGHGFDIHRMVPLVEAKQPIVIGGVVIAHPDQKWLDVDGTYAGTPRSIYETQLGVLAHSDGDVVYHSLVDAIFGALTLPDIGQVFEDTDPRWRGCDSSKFVEHAHRVMTHYDYRIGNVDVTLILERPKVAEFKPRMKENIVRLLHTTDGRVNIKARTHERLDSVGELRGVSCHVVVTLEAMTTTTTTTTTEE